MPAASATCRQVPMMAEDEHNGIPALGDPTDAGESPVTADGAADEPAEAAADAAVDAAVDAAAEALARARAAARAKGLRPGMTPRPRRRIDGSGVRSGASPSVEGRDPVLLGEQIDALVADRAWQGEVAVGAVIGRWPQIVGADVAQHCHASDFTDGVLTIRADSSAWATQLRLLSSALLGRITTDVGPDIVHELRVVGPAAPSWSRGSLRAAGGRGPRDTYG